MKLFRNIQICLLSTSVALMASCGNFGRPASVVPDAVPDTVVIAEADTTAAIELADTTDNIILADSLKLQRDSFPPKPQETAAGSATDSPGRISSGATYTPVSGVHGSKLICLTFDDGPSNKTTPKVLDVMEKYGAHCTFFCVGSCITSSTKHNLVRAESLGCEIANHTYSHPVMTKLSAQRQIEEVDKTNEKICDAVGHLPVFFRPPYLAINSNVLSNLGLVAITGSSSDDWVTSKSPQRIVNDVMKLARDGAIIVMHDLGANSRTPVALETLVPRLQAEGYTLVTISELFASKGQHPQLHKSYGSVR